jgi:BR serine/threonine kinase
MEPLIHPSIPNYEIIDTLSHSDNCTVFSARNRTTNTEVALKFVSRINLSNPAVLAAFEQECRVHESLRHDAIIEIVEILYQPSYVCVVMELGRHGDLLQWIATAPCRPAPLVISYFRRILYAVQFLHSRGIAHLDLKPENMILFGTDEIKLTDFGCCQPVATGRPIQSSGTLTYAAPELIRGSKHDNRPADIWSLGIILCAIQSGQLPFMESPEGVDTERWLEGQILDGRLTFPMGMPDWICAIIRQCCQVDPAARPTVNELLNLPVLRDANAGRHSVSCHIEGFASRRRLSARSIGKYSRAAVRSVSSGWKSTRRASNVGVPPSASPIRP